MSALCFAVAKQRISAKQASFFTFKLSDNRRDALVTQGELHDRLLDLW